MSKRQFLTFVCSVFAVWSLSVTAVKAQVVPATRVEIANANGNAITFDNTNVAGGNDYAWFLSSSAMEFDVLQGGGGIVAFRIANSTKTGTMAMTGTGVGIGTSSPTAELHVLGDGGPFTNSRIFVQNTGSEMRREMLRLENNGGAAIQFNDTSASGGQYKLENVIGLFEIANTGPMTGGVNFRILPGAGHNLFNLNSLGAGIGTLNPVTSLHIIADGADSPLTTANIRCEVTNALPAQDRNMFQLWNNGAVVMDFMDTSVSPAAQYQIRTASDRFSFQQFGGPRAGLVIFADGAVRFVANQAPNLTITPNGSVNVVGSGVGGGNLSVGLGANIGPTDGNLFVKRNIQFSGQLLGPSDRNLKENFEEIDAKEVLAKVANLPITKWNYKADENRTLHIGPMAQDFKAAFGLGDNEKKISMMDSDGVALAAIKGLSQIVDDKNKEIANLKDTVKAQAELADRQAELLVELAERLERLEAAVGPNSN
jgi:hypothetical protein